MDYSLCINYAVILKLNFFFQGADSYTCSKLPCPPVPKCPSGYVPEDVVVCCPKCHSKFLQRFATHLYNYIFLVLLLTLKFMFQVRMSYLLQFPLIMWVKMIMNQHSTRVPSPTECSSVTPPQWLLKIRKMGVLSSISGYMVGLNKHTGIHLMSFAICNVLTQTIIVEEL